MGGEGGDCRVRMVLLSGYRTILVRYINGELLDVYIMYNCTPHCCVFIIWDNVLKY